MRSVYSRRTLLLEGQIEQHADTNLDFDVVVLGAGISGLAVARECANKGLKTALYEANQIGAATSANSLRIIHGGFRYLQTLNLPRVITSLYDQARVAKEFPDLVKELPCYLPLNRSGLKSRWPLYFAACLYKQLAIFKGLKALETDILSEKEVQRRLKFYSALCSNGAFLWHDLQLLDPAMLHERLAKQIRDAKGYVYENTRVLSIERIGSHWEVLIRAGQVDSHIKAKYVVNTLGPWKDTLPIKGIERRNSLQSWCRAFNLVFHGNTYGTFGAAIPAQAGRMYFLVGREGELAFGTEYLPLSESIDRACITESELEAFIAAIRSLVPGLNMTKSSLKRIELGVLPVTSISNMPEKHLVGSSQIRSNQGYIEVLSTKYTTFLSQARAVLALIQV